MLGPSNRVLRKGSLEVIYLTKYLKNTVEISYKLKKMQQMNITWYKIIHMLGVFIYHVDKKCLDKQNK